MLKKSPKQLQRVSKPGWKRRTPSVACIWTQMLIIGMRSAYTIIPSLISSAYLPFQMEEDDDNFLDGVIDFGDGRQYTVQPAGGVTKTPPPGHSPRLPEVSSPEVPTVPVSKQERFANSDDFDRTWPRSKTSPSIPPREFPTQRHPPGQRSPSLSQPQQSPKEASRVLFNERSNRLEPYASGHPSHRPPQGPPHLQRRGPGSEFATSPVEPINQRDGFPSNVQLLQKQSGAPHDFPPSRGGNFGPPGNRGHPRRDGMPPPMPESKRTGDGFVPHTHVPQGFRDNGIPPGRGRRLSDMGPPPLPPSDRFKDAGRQNPPHLSQAMPPSPLEFRSPSLRGLHSLPPPGPPSAHTGSVHSVSPTLSRPDALPMSASSELDEVQKDVMQSAAARAKQRRQQEEEERAKAQERARKKAAELAEVQKAKESETVSKTEVCVIRRLG
jgi:serine/arginine repetitive matrix protein 2